MKRAGCDEEYVIGLHHAVARVDRSAFDDRQDVALHTFARNIRALAAFASGDLVDLVQENDSRGFDSFDRKPRDLIHINQLLLLFLDQIFHRLVDAHLSGLRAPTEHVREHVAQVYVHLFDTLRRVDFEVSGRGSFLNFQFDYSRVQASFAKLLSELLASALELLERGVAFGFFYLLAAWEKQIEHSLFGILLGFVRDFGNFLFAHQIDAYLDQVSDHRLDVAANVTNFGEL